MTGAAAAADVAGAIADPEAGWAAGREPAAALGPDLAARLEAIIDRRGARHMGLAVGVYAGGRTACFARGRLHRDRQGSPAPDTLFEIGSITKTFTAALLALMAAAGEVALDDPLQQYLPPGVTLPVRGRPITLADLATHNSGLPASHPGMLRHWWRHRADPYADITFDDLYMAVSRTRLKAAPGKNARYSNFGFGLLGNALAVRVGMDYETLVLSRVCAPLGLTDTIATVDDERAGRFAQGHDRRGRPVSHWELPTLAGAGALRSTVVDMLAYLRAQLDAEVAGAEGAPSNGVREPSFAGALERPSPGALEAPPGTSEQLRAALRLTHQPRVGGRFRIGLGWILLPQKGRPYPLVFHTGGTGGFRSFAAFVPQTQTAVVALANDGRSPDRLGMELSTALQDAVWS